MSVASDAHQQQPTTEGAPVPGLFQKLWFLRPYWVSEQKWKTRLQLGGILALTVAEIAITAWVGFGFQAALSALVAKNVGAFALTGVASLPALALPLSREMGEST
jgi:ABC-type uncharacterized transport system fused permease/ATPase subunit